MESGYWIIPVTQCLAIEPQMNSRFHLRPDFGNSAIPGICSSEDTLERNCSSDDRTVTSNSNSTRDWAAKPTCQRERTMKGTHQ